MAIQRHAPIRPAPPGLGDYTSRRSGAQGGRGQAASAAAAKIGSGPGRQLRLWELRFCESRSS
jgi:hypothetical protein